NKGAQVIKQMAVSLSEQLKFPDLEGWEDAQAKIQSAKEAIVALRRYLNMQKTQTDDAKACEEARKTAHQRMQDTIKKRQTLETLSERLKELSKRIGSAEAGYKFQDWFFDLVDYFEVTNRRPYISSGRQIDGSVTVEGTTYLTELKFTSGQAGAPDVDTFLAKVNDKADNTMGIMISMSGYSSTAIEQASGRNTPIILLDHGHVYLVLSGSWTLAEMVSRVRRHASQTARAFLAASEFGA
ncbi:MAG: restriction endonuclease, partial [Terriglobia bacterium]